MTLIESSSRFFGLAASRSPRFRGVELSVCAAQCQEKTAKPARRKVSSGSTFVYRRHVLFHLLSLLLRYLCAHLCVENASVPLLLNELFGTPMRLLWSDQIHPQSQRHLNPSSPTNSQSATRPSQCGQRRTRTGAFREVGVGLKTLCPA